MSQKNQKQLKSPVSRLICPISRVRTNVVTRVGDKEPEIQEKMTGFSTIMPQNINTVRQNINKVKKGDLKEREVLSEENEFCYQDGKLIMHTQQKKIYIGNFWIEITKEIKKITPIVNENNTISGTSTEVYWEVRIFCANRKFEATVGIENLENVKRMRKITEERFYLDETREARKLYIRYIQQIIQKNEYPCEWLVEKAGWIQLNTGKWVYLYSGGIVGEMGSEIRASKGYALSLDEKRMGGQDIFGEIFSLRTLCPQKKNTIFLLHYMCLSVCTTLFQTVGYPINFLTAVIGTTNSQKTAVATIFSRIFNRTENLDADYRFDSTEVALQEGMEKYADGMLFVDDFLPFEDVVQKRVQIKKLETLARAYGDRVPRKRSKVYAKVNNVQEYAPVNGCCLITGETLATSTLSTNTRIIQLFFERGDIDLNKLSFFQKNLRNVPTFLYDFIAFIQANINDVFHIISTEMEMARKQNFHGISTPRFKNVYGIMCAITRIFYRYSVAKGFCNAEMAQYYREEDLQSVFEILLENERECQIKNQGTLICEALIWGIRAEKIQLIVKTEASKLSWDRKAIIDVGAYFCVLPEHLWEVYKEFCENKKTSMMYKSGRELSKPLFDESLILVKKEGEKKRRTHKFEGKRCFFIYREKVLERAQSIEEF